MKQKIILYASFLIVLFQSCKKGDSYYQDFQAKESYYDGTILEFLESNSSQYDSLLLVLDIVPELRGRLGALDSQTTFFAPTNSNFEISLDAVNIVRRVANLPLIGLEDIPYELMDTTINKYALNGIYATKDIQNYGEGIVVPSIKGYDMHMIYETTSSSGLLGGGEQRIKFSDTNNSIFQRYWEHSFTSIVNIRTKNGVVHILAPSHNFSFSKFTSILTSN